MGTPEEQEALIKREHSETYECDKCGYEMCIDLQCSKCRLKEVGDNVRRIIKNTCIGYGGEVPEAVKALAKRKLLGMEAMEKVRRRRKYERLRREQERLQQEQERSRREHERLERQRELLPGIHEGGDGDGGGNAGSCGIF